MKELEDMVVAALRRRKLPVFDQEIPRADQSQIARHFGAQGLTRNPDEFIAWLGRQVQRSGWRPLRLELDEAPPWRAKGPAVYCKLVGRRRRVILRFLVGGYYPPVRGYDR